MEERHENFVAAVRKWEMLAATEVKMSGSEKKKTNKQTMNKNTLGSFWKFHVVVVQNNVTEMYKKCAAHEELLFR